MKIECAEGDFYKVVNSYIINGHNGTLTRYRSKTDAGNWLAHRTYTEFSMFIDKKFAYEGRLRTRISDVLIEKYPIPEVDHYKSGLLNIPELGVEDLWVYIIGGKMYDEYGQEL